MVIFNSYVKLPEGNYNINNIVIPCYSHINIPILTNITSIILLNMGISMVYGIGWRKMEDLLVF